MKRILVVVCFSLLAVLVRAQDYRITGIGSLGGNTYDCGLNSSGEVIGESEIWLYGDDHSFVWTRESGISDLDELVGQHLDVCNLNPSHSVNSHGAIVGRYGTPSHAFMWAPPFPQVQDLGTLGGPSSLANGINDAGDVVGGADRPTGPGHAFLWSSALGMQDIDGSPNYESWAVAINNFGQVTGVRDHGNGVQVVFLWTQDGGLQELGFQGRPYAINDNGEIVGLLSNYIGHAFYWSKSTGMQDLGTLPGDTYSEAVSINNHGQVVGTSASSAESVPFIWTATDGMKALAPMKGRWGTAAINDAGQVLVSHGWGWGYRPRVGIKLLTPLMHVALVSSLNPSKPGDLVTFTATVSSVQGPANGTILFRIDKKQSRVELSAGQADFSTAKLGQGTHTITAQYVRNPLYYGSTSNIVQVVNP